MNDEPRGNWYLLTGLLLGLGLGVLISLVLSPVSYTDVEPSALAENARSEYRHLIALAYQADGNLPRARDRLALLQDSDPAHILAAQAQRILAEGGSPDDARSMASLAAALSGDTPHTVASPVENSTAQSTGAAATDPTQPAGSVPGDGTPLDNPPVGEAIRTATPILPTATPRPTSTPRPSATPPRVLDAPFKLISKAEVCDNSLPAGDLAIQINDRAGQPLAGVPILITWGSGQSAVFYTGLAPEINPGYADFQMDPAATYTLKVGEASDPLNDLGVPSCAGGAWKIEFQEGGG